MLRINGIKIPVESDESNFADIICEVLNVSKKRLNYFEIIRRSLDARKKYALSFVYTVDVSIKNEKNYRACKKNIKKISRNSYSFPKPGNKSLRNRPVVTGSGPAGLFCAYFLAKYGYKPIIIERGEPVEKRIESVNNFWMTSELNPDSNVQFGEGGAGTFSDGKLNSSISDKEGRVKKVLELFAEHGAPGEILYDSKPHIGTDVLCGVVINLRNSIKKYGGTFLYQNKLTDIIVSDGAIKALFTTGERLDTEVCILAIGHSARDTFKMLYNRGVKMQPKPFAVGVRIQHEQNFINMTQWGENAPKKLGQASYKFTSTAADKRAVYTFCMCPGGYIINASSEPGHLAINGMSRFQRNSFYANSAVVVSISPKDFFIARDNKCPSVLTGVALQRELERNAYLSASGAIPIQRFEDFKNNKITSSSVLKPSACGSWEFADVRGIYPDFIAEDIIFGISDFAKKFKSFDMPDALLAGVESRTSSPVRILRDSSFQSNIEGLYPCGEGAGYAGGIVSAAVDGIKVAEAIGSKYKKISEV